MLVPASPTQITPTLTDAPMSASEYGPYDKADATRRGYLSNFRDFVT